MGSLPYFSHICEPNTCLLDALNLPNGPTNDWDSNLESFSSVRDFFPASEILVYDVCFGWISDI